MWKLGVVLLLVSAVNGQEQFHREVKNPTGPSQIILRGGFLGNSAIPNEVEVVQDQQEQQQNELSDPQPQALPLQANLDDQPIPDGGADNPFTNGNAGFGQRLTQEPPAQFQSQQPIQQQQPQVIQQQQQPQPQIQHAGPILQQAPLTLPPLPPGQQYVDLYGRPIIFTEQQVTQPQQQPIAQPPQPATQPPPLQKQAFVDQYGRQLGEIQIQQPVVPLAYNVVQPVVQNVHVGPAGVVQNVAQPAAVEVPLLHNAPPPLTLQTYAVPTVRQVGDLVIPYAQKITVAKKLKEGVVFPPTVNAHAIVKSKHRTVFSPVKAVAPVAAEVHAAPAAVVQQQIQTAEVHATAPVLYQEHQQVLVEQPHVAVAHHPQQLVQVTHHQPVAVAHHQVAFAHAPQQFVQVAHHQPVAVAHQPQQLVQVTHHQPVAVAHPQVEVVHHVQQPHHIVQVEHPAPVVVKKVKQVLQKTIIPDVTLIHQPVLPKALFQKHIFNVKHGSQPLIYQDLCTVYPFQKNLRACVLKKAVLPELHHPDIRTINVQEVPRLSLLTDQTIVAGGSAIVAPIPKPQSQLPSTPTVTVTKNAPQNIQDTIRRESARSKAAADAQKEDATTTTPQPETAESRDSSAPEQSSRRRRKGSSKK